MKTVNSNFLRILAWLDEGIEPRSSDYEAVALIKSLDHVQEDPMVSDLNRPQGSLCR